MSTFSKQNYLNGYCVGQSDLLAEQAKQEPAAWMVYTQDGQSVYVTDNPTDIQEGQRALPLYTTPQNAEIKSVRMMRDVQGQNGNWNYDPYMHGLYNGLEFAMSLLEKREPQFRDAPEDWLGDIRIKRNNFNNTKPMEQQ